MIDVALLTVSLFEQLKNIRVRGHVSMNKVHSVVRKRGRKSLPGRIIDIAKEDMSAVLMEEADRRCSDSIGTS